MNDLISLRQFLHHHPELSGHEYQTAQHIFNLLKSQSPSHLIEEVGGTWIVASYDFGSGGPNLLFRCELDALPINENIDIPYKSVNEGVSHKCGHDGHMTIIAGLAKWLSVQSFDSGTVYLVFQPAEETGQGAKRMLEDPRVKELRIDAAFALHNIPGTSMNEVIIPKESFSPSEQSFALTLTGKESHASEPEKGINPGHAIAKIIDALQALNRSNEDDPNFSLLTPVHINMGQKAYGISPGIGEVHYTVRTWKEETMTQLVNQIELICSEISVAANLRHNIEWFEYFPASSNHHDTNEKVERAANEINVSVQHQKYPFRFGEDFGWFSQRYESTMFGLGSGLSTPPLHDSQYDFPDELIQTGIDIFSEIVKIYLQK